MNKLGLLLNTLALGMCIHLHWLIAGCLCASMILMYVFKIHDEEKA